MELLYSMRRKPLKCEPPHFERSTDPEIVRPICTISTGNIIAFSSPTELSDVDGDTWGGHVYVCDLDTPWDSHKVVSTTHPVSALEWDGEGKQLLVGTTEGELSVYGQKDYLLNEWTCLYSATFPGERIVKGIFFSNGRRLVMTDKKHDAPISERIQALRPTPTLKGFGGSWTSGVIAVSMSGLVLALTAHAQTHDSLRAHRDHVTSASFQHKSGSTLLACVCSVSAGSAVRVWSVRMRAPPAAPHAAPLLHVQPLPTITADHLYSTVPASISWCSRGDSDCLVLADSALTMWKLTERAQPVHKLLAKGPVQGSTTPGGGQKPGSDCFNTLVWQQSGGWSIDSRVPTAVCSGGTAPGGGGGGAHSALLAVAGADVMMLAHDSHHVLCARTVNTSGLDTAAASPPKKPKYGNSTVQRSCAGAILSSVCVSSLGGVAVCVDTHSQLHVFRLLQAADIPPPLFIQQSCSLLEMALVSGHDYLDVLLALKPTLVDGVYDRITEVFQRQPPAFQQYYYNAWIKMRTALLSLLWSPSACLSVSWLRCAGVVRGAGGAAAAALRGDERDDKHIAASLDDTHPEHDKALVAVESKPDLSVDTNALSALRRPLQRVHDIAVTVLAAVAANAHTQQTHQHFDLLSNAPTMSMLRRLVAVSRGSGGDATLSRLLARLQHGVKPDVVEECAAFAASRPSARVWEALPRTAVSAPHQQPYPLYLEYGTTPESLSVRPEPPSWLGDAAPNTDMDSIRYMYLGLSPTWRSCSRCGARALRHPHPAKHPLQRAHDARFLPACRCGGKWSLVSNI